MRLVLVEYNIFVPSILKALGIKRKVAIAKTKDQVQSIFDKWNKKVNYNYSLGVEIWYSKSELLADKEFLSHFNNIENPKDIVKGWSYYTMDGIRLVDIIELRNIVYKYDYFAERMNIKEGDYITHIFSGKVHKALTDINPNIFLERTLLEGGYYMDSLCSCCYDATPSLYHFRKSFDEEIALAIESENE